MNANDAAAQVKCPECGAKPGELCVYLYPKSMGQYVYSIKQQALIARAGKPTQRPHTGRFAAAWRKQNAKALREVRLAGRPQDPHAKARAGWFEYGWREQEQLKEWLRRHGRILWTT